MKAFQLRPYQANAIKAIQEALIRKQQHIVIEMAAGCGKEIILARTLQLLSEQSQEKILIATGSLLLKEHLEHDIFTVFDEFVKFDKDNLVIQTAQRILKHPHASFGDFSVVIFYDIAIPKALHDALSCNKKQLLLFLLPINNPRTILSPLRTLCFRMVMRML